LNADTRRLPRQLLITGGCGFIAANLIPRLARAGNVRIRALDNESLGQRAHIADLPAEFVHADIRDRAALDRALAGVDAVIHLAAHTRVIESIENPAYNFEINASGTLTLLEAMRAAGVRRLINASTGGAILGEVEPPVHENMVPRPIAPYGASKLTAEAYCMAYTGSYGLRALSLRFSNVYGPRSFHKGSVVAAFIKRILANERVHIYGDGSQVRDYVFVDDLCDGIIAGVNADVSGVIQLGSGIPVTVDQLLDALSEVVRPRTIERVYEPFRDGEIRHTYCDIRKAREELGYDPRTPLREGLARTWNWFVAQQGGG
jgi:UDP-glucose 4-epimerase